MRRLTSGGGQRSITGSRRAQGTAGGGLIAATGADFRIGGDRAFYNPTYDFIQMPRPDAYYDYYTASTLRSESSTFRLDQTILFTTRDAPEHDALEKAISRTPQIDHWLASDFAGAIMFDEGDAVQRAAGHESKCRAHDNLNAIPQAASVTDKAAA